MDYPTIRDRFLASHRDGKDQALLLIEVGRYVQHCWLAEEHERSQKPGSELAEVDLFHLWDQCNEVQFEDICVKAREELAEYTRRQTAAVFRTAVRRRLKPVKWLISLVLFVLKEAASGFVGAIGLLVFGAMLLLLQPQMVKDLRQLLDNILPATTQPDRPAGG